MTNPRDLRYELDLFYRLQDATVDGVPLTEFSIFKDAPLWHRFSQAIFDGDIRRFGDLRSFSQAIEKEKSFKKPLGVFFASLFAICMWSVAWVAALITRPRVLVLSVDKVSDKKEKCDFRLSGLYRFLRKNRIGFTECFHTTLGRSLYTNFFRRLRASLYLEAFDELWYWFRTLSGKRSSYRIERVAGTDEEIRFIRHLITKYLDIRGLLEFRAALLTFFLKTTGVRLVLGIDDVRHYHELLEAAKRTRVPSCMLQHGHFTKYHVGWLRYRKETPLVYPHADILLVWSTYWKEELMRLGSVYPVESIVVAGYSDDVRPKNFAPRVDGAPIVVIPHETDSPKKDVSEYIRALTKDGTVRVYLKVRPDISEDDQLAEYDGDMRRRVIVVASIEGIPRPDAVLGVYSTFLYDMALLGVPVLMMETSMDYGEGMIRNGIARSVRKEDVVKTLNDLLGKKDHVSDRLRTEANFEETLASICRGASVL